MLAQGARLLAVCSFRLLLTAVVEHLTRFCSNIYAGSPASGKTLRECSMIVDDILSLVVAPAGSGGAAADPKPDKVPPLFADSRFGSSRAVVLPTWLLTDVSCRARRLSCPFSGPTNLVRLDRVIFCLRTSAGRLPSPSCAPFVNSSPHLTHLRALSLLSIPSPVNVSQLTTHVITTS